MIKAKEYISLHEVLSRVLRHPMLQSVDLEQAVQYAVEFMSMFGLPSFFEDRIDEIEIKDYRGLIPCDVISVNQVRDKRTGICLQAMSGTFYNGKERLHQEGGFKIQNKIIYTSFKDGMVEMSYKTFILDCDGIPLVPDNQTFLKCLESYIKEIVFTIKFDMGQLNQNVLNKAQQDYAWYAGKLKAEFTIPSLSEMETLKNSYNTMISKQHEFKSGFTTLGEIEKINRH